MNKAKALLRTSETSKEEKEDEEEGEDEAEASSKERSTPQSKIIGKEEKSVGDIGWSVFSDYVRSVHSRSLVICILAFAALVQVGHFRERDIYMGLVTMLTLYISDYEDRN